MTQLQVTEFDTGAVRDRIEIPVRWDLMSGIALREVAAISKHNEFRSWRQFSPMELVGFTIEEIFFYIGGCRKEPHLALAFRHLMYAIQLNENQTGQLDETEAMMMAIGPESQRSNGLQWLSHKALRHLASTLNEGCDKYGEWNWMYGFPLVSCLNHALDHLYNIVNADQSEDHWGHALCNLMFAIHFEQTRPDLCRGMLADGYQITDEIKKTLDHQRKQRAAVKKLEEERARGLVESGLAERPFVSSGDEWKGGAPNADGSTALGRAIHTARGGPAPIHRHGHA